MNYTRKRITIVQTGLLSTNETSISYYRSNDAALLGTDAIRLFYAGAIRGDGGVWSDGISVLHKAEGDSSGDFRSAGTAVSAHLQDCAGTDDVECDRCTSGGSAHRLVCVREANGEENNGELSATATLRPDEA